MKILSVTKKEIEVIETDDIFLNMYLRFSDKDYYHEIDRNGGTYLKVNDSTNLEEARNQWMKKTST